MSESAKDMSVCPDCGAPWVRWDGVTESTLVGYMATREGHDHNNNCLVRGYTCANGHAHRLSVRRRCGSHSDCDWRGKETCFCHEGKKLDEWPVIGGQG